MIFEDTGPSCKSCKLTSIEISKIRSLEDGCSSWTDGLETLKSISVWFSKHSRSQPIPWLLSHPCESNPRNPGADQGGAAQEGFDGSSCEIKDGHIGMCQNLWWTIYCKGNFLTLDHPKWGLGMVSYRVYLIIYFWGWTFMCKITRSLVSFHGRPCL